MRMNRTNQQQSQDRSWTCKSSCSNEDGHIIRWRDTEQHTGTNSSEIFLISEETMEQRLHADPDGLWIDPDGRLFIQTDGGQKDGSQPAFSGRYQY